MIGPLNPKDATVLLVEDNSGDSVIAVRALKAFGIKNIYTAETGEDALRFIAEHACDVVLVDYHLPRMNGLRMIESLRAVRPDLGVIMVTGAKQEQVAVAAMKAGADDYISKDDMLTSGIINSLQAVLRGHLADRDTSVRAILAAGDNKLEQCIAELDWLLDAFSPDPEANGYRQPLACADSYDSDDWRDVIETLTRYLHACFGGFQSPVATEEDALVQMFLERGTSPHEIAMVFRATLRAHRAGEGGDGDEIPMSATVCLAKVLFRLVGEYQSALSLAAVAQRAG